MVIRIGDAVSLSRPENFKYTPDDRQTVIETDGGNIVQDYGHISSGDRINFSAVFRRDEFMKIWEYFTYLYLLTSCVFSHTYFLDSL